MPVSGHGWVMIDQRGRQQWTVNAGVLDTWESVGANEGKRRARD